jgi:cytochrome c556
MKKLFLALSALAFATSAVQADAIADRKAIMKERGQIVGGLSKMAKGETPFDAEAVKTQLAALNANAEKFDIDALFPAGSETGGETTAAPAIWSDMAGFKAAHEKEAAAVKAAVDAAPADAAALGAVLGPIGQACGGCHETFRIKKD